MPVKGPYPVVVVALMGWRFGLVEPSLGASAVLWSRRVHLAGKTLTW